MNSDDRVWVPDDEVTCLYCQRYKNRTVCRCGDPNPPVKQTLENTVCDKACENCSTTAKKKFQPGNIVRLINNERMSAEKGATALVVGYKNDGKEYLRVFWLSSLANNQSNGGYPDENFELLRERMEEYRPDIIPEDRAIVTSKWTGTTAVEQLERAVKVVRDLPDHNVVCTVLIETVVTETHTETKQL